MRTNLTTTWEEREINLDVEYIHYEEDLPSSEDPGQNEHAELGDIFCNGTKINHKCKQEFYNQIKKETLEDHNKCYTEF